MKVRNIGQTVIRGIKSLIVFKNIISDTFFTTIE